MTLLLKIFLKISLGFILFFLLSHENFDLRLLLKVIKHPSKDRIITDLISSASTGKSAFLRSPHSIRPWQHVLEPLSGYLLVGQKLWEKEVSMACSWDFGPRIRDCISVVQMAKLAKNFFPAISYQVSEKATDLHETTNLKLDCAKSESELGWFPLWNVSTSVEKTSKWYDLFLREGKLQTEQNLSDYLKAASQARVVWVKN